jgi:hypothetical protein
MNRLRLRATALCAALLLGGAAVGAVAMLMFYDAALLAQSRRPAEQVHIERVLWGLDHILKLSAVQKERLTGVMRQHSPELRAFLASIEPRAQSLRQAYQEDIRRELTVEQQAKFDELFSGEEARRRASLQEGP